MLTRAIVLSAGLIGSCLPNPASSVTSGVTLDCSAPKEAAAGESLKLRCVVQNSTQQEIFLFTRPLDLEGPSDSSDSYSYRSITGRRYENVLHYNRERAGLTHPSLFKKRFYIASPELVLLERIGAGKSMTIEVEWQLPASPPALPGEGTWLARAKLVFLTMEDAHHLLREASGPPKCLNTLARAIEKTDAAASIQLVAVRHDETVRRMEECVEVSQAMHHLTSNMFAFHLERQ